MRTRKQAPAFQALPSARPHTQGAVPSSLLHQVCFLPILLLPPLLGGRTPVKLSQLPSILISPTVMFTVVIGLTESSGISSPNFHQTGDIVGLSLQYLMDGPGSKVCVFSIRLDITSPGQDICLPIKLGAFGARPKHVLSVWSSPRAGKKLGTPLHSRDAAEYLKARHISIETTQSDPNPGSAPYFPCDLG